MKSKEFVKSNGVPLLQLAGIEQEFLDYLTETGAVKYDAIRDLRGMRAHPGWKILEAFISHYILRDSVGLALSETNPEFAARHTEDLPKLDGTQWAGRLARMGGVIQGQLSVISLPAALEHALEDVNERK